MVVAPAAAGLAAAAAAVVAVVAVAVAGEPENRRMRTHNIKMNLCSDPLLGLLPQEGLRGVKHQS